MYINIKTGLLWCIRELGLRVTYHACRQQVYLQGSSSQWGEVSVDVPQGSILSSNVNISSAEHDLQEDLNLIYHWLYVNLLSLSVKKSNLILVGSRQNSKIMI